MRQRYETREQREAEDALARRIGLDRGIDFRRMPDKYFVDFMGWRGKRAVGLMEAKVRHGVLRHPDYMVSYLKTMRGVELAEKLRIPFIYVLDTGEGVLSLNVLNLVDRFGLGWFGPVPPRDDQDHEPAVVIDWELFVPIQWKKEAA